MFIRLIEEDKDEKERIYCENREAKEDSDYQ